MYTFLWTSFKKKNSSLTKIEKRYEELLQEILEEHKKLGKINQKIKQHEITERLNIK